MTDLQGISEPNDYTSGHYIPSTGRVRADYIHGVGGTTWYEGKAAAIGEVFDRWLYTHDLHKKARAAIAERRRIIKLLENADNHRDDVNPEWYEGLAHAIALIKGEQE